MVFSDKLNYLFELTHAEGKELAASMNVTPPQISKMRRGNRGLPKNKDDAYIIAYFFATRCNNNKYRELLSQKIGIESIKLLDTDSAMTEALLDWLSDERSRDEYAAKRADDFLRRFGAVFNDVAEVEQLNEQESPINTDRNSFFSYYGSSGKRLAVKTFLNYLIKLKQEFTINILTDESISWIIEETDYSKELCDIMVKLTDLGSTFRRVAGPLSDINEAFESLNRWFPLHMTGKATSYYYKRMRDNLNRITLIVVRDVAVLFSFSVGVVPAKNCVTFFTLDTRTVNSMADEFEKYIALCEPIMKVHSVEKSYKRLHECMVRYEEFSGNCIQRNNSLSLITLPWDIATSMRGPENTNNSSEFLTCLAKRYKAFKSNLRQHTFIDILRIADVESVINGTVMIPASNVLGAGNQYYTVSAYLQHLRSILYLLEHYKNYYVVLRKPDEIDSTIVCIKEGFCAILVHDTVPFTMYEVSERFLVDSFSEYLKRLIPDDAESNKKVTASAIRKTIKAIEAAVPGTNLIQLQGY